jgi:RepB DNA-primase from phage plasmid
LVALLGSLRPSCFYTATWTPPFTEWFYRYPAELDKAQRELRQYASSNNLYYCAHLLTKPKRDKEHAAMVRAVWGDGDTCSPDKLLVAPSIVIESSPGRWQYLWLLDEPMSPQEAEQLCRRIAYFHRADGFDVSGWDLTQLLRIPGTLNVKYATPYPTVRIITGDGPSNYRPADFTSKYPPVADPEPTGQADAPLPDTGTRDQAQALLASIPDDDVRARMRELFSNTPADKRWSHDLAELIWGSTPLSVVSGLAVLRFGESAT